MKSYEDLEADRDAWKTLCLTKVAEVNARFIELEQDYFDECEKVQRALNKIEELESQLIKFLGKSNVSQ